MKTILVKPATSFPVYPSAEIAISEAKTHKQFKPIGSTVPVVRNVSFSDASLALHLDDASTVVIEFGKSATVEFGARVGELTLQRDPLPNRLLLKFPSGQTVLWDRGSIISMFRGRTLQGIFSSPPAVFLYLGGLNTFMIAGLQLIETNQLMLYWAEVE